MRNKPSESSSRPEPADDAGGVRLGDLARQIGATLSGDPAHVVSEVASLRRAGRRAVGFLNDRARVGELDACNAGAVILSREFAGLTNLNRLIVEEPLLGFMAACELLRAPPKTAEGIHPRAWIHESATLGTGCGIGPNVVVDEGAVLGARVTVGANAAIGAGVVIGERTVIGGGVQVYPGTRIGRDCRIDAGAVLGSPGFGYVETPAGWKHAPQLGRLIIGDRVDVGANTTIDRGALDDTVIEDGVKLDNQIQVAHNVLIGEDTAIAGCTGIAGSARIGKRCKIGGRASILGHLEIADDVVIHATTTVTSSLTEAGRYASNLAAQKAGRWRRNLARLGSLDEFAKRLRAVEKTTSSKTMGE